MSADGPYLTSAEVQAIVSEWHDCTWRADNSAEVCATCGEWRPEVYA